jgi:type IV pilus assembly protein PilE
MASDQVTPGLLKLKGVVMKRNQRGVTLIELLTVVAVVGILAAIAIPSYRRYLVRANRTDAKTALLQTAQALERCYTNSAPYAYNSATCAAAVTLPFTVASGFYVISAADSGPAAQTYRLLATPQGTQATQDGECGTFSLSQAGLQAVTGTFSAAPERCWRR